MGGVVVEDEHAVLWGEKGVAEKEMERRVGSMGGVLVEDEHAVLW